MNRLGRSRRRHPVQRPLRYRLGSLRRNRSHGRSARRRRVRSGRLGLVKRLQRVQILDARIVVHRAHVRVVGRVFDCPGLRSDARAFFLGSHRSPATSTVRLTGSLSRAGSRRSRGLVRLEPRWRTGHDPFSHRAGTLDVDRPTFRSGRRHACLSMHSVRAAAGTAKADDENQRRS